MPTSTASGEAIEQFDCFGSSCAVYVGGDGPRGPAAAAAAEARRRLLAWHRQFSRFDPRSELVSLNRDDRSTVPVSPMMARLVEAAAAAGALTAGVVDATLVEEVERAGYDKHFDTSPVSLREALARAPQRRPAAPSASGGWRELSVDRGAGTVTRPAGVRVDSGGIAKGLFADALALELAAYSSFAIDCGGDIRIGGVTGVGRGVEVSGPLDGEVLHRFVLREGAVATSGIGARSWLRAHGRPAHHLIDPATGEPAFTGIAQVTALAPSGVLAEALSKAALLSGVDGAERWLTRGGVIVYDDGSHCVVEAMG